MPRSIYDPATVVAVFAVWLAQFGWSQEVIKSPEVEVNQTNLVECAIQNAKSLLSGDVLIFRDETFDNSEILANGDVSGVLRRVKTTWRVVFDTRRESYCYYLFQENSVVDFDDEAARDSQPKTSEDFQYSGACYGGPNTSVFLMINKSRESLERQNLSSSNHDFLGLLGFPDPRGLMLGGPLGPIDDVYLSTETLPNESSAGLFVSSISRLGRSIVVTSENENSGIPDQTVLIKNRYDGLTLMRDSTEINFKKKDEPGEIFFERRKYRWRESEGVFVPALVTEKQKQSLKFEERDVAGINDTTYRLEWSSINKEVDDRHFTGELLTDQNSIRQQLQQPASVNAGQ